MRHAANTTLNGTFCAARAVVLRPSLRAAASLESRYGFQNLFAACADGNLTIMADVIETSSDTRDFLKSIADMPLNEIMPSLMEAIPSHILALAGVDQEKKSESASGEFMPFAQYYERLFRIGTGWLGWSPTVTWDATATEILEAYSGHVEKLRAIHGGKEDEETRPTDKPEDAVFDRAGLMALKSMGRS
jgi:hypothetical protein